MFESTKDRYDRSRMEAFLKLATELDADLGRMFNGLFVSKKKDGRVGMWTNAKIAHIRTTGLTFSKTRAGQ